MNPMAIETNNLTKRYGSKTAVDTMSLHIPTGSVVGLLGPNGSGKTTLLRMLVGHLHPTLGTVKTLGSDPWRKSATELQRIAYVSQRMQLPGWMTAGQAISMNARLFPRWNRRAAEDLLEEFSISEATKFRRLSGGQQRKLMILLAIAQSSDLLLLDEPSVGLDIESRNLFLQRVLDSACEQNRTVVVSSHLLSDLERMVDRIVLIRDGRLLLEGDLLDLKTSVRKIQILEDVSHDTLHEIFDCLRIDQPSLHETIVTVRDFSQRRADRLVEQLASADRMRVESFNLEQLYLELVTQTKVEVTGIENLETARV